MAQQETAQPRRGVSQQELEARLWAAANSLRGPVDPSDFKAYIFPLLFFERVSDTWDEEHAKAVADYGSDVTAEVEADYHRFQLPAGSHLSDLRRLHENVGVELQNILVRIQGANPEALARSERWRYHGDIPTSHEIREAWGHAQAVAEALDEPWPPR